MIKNLCMESYMVGFVSYVYLGKVKQDTLMFNYIIEAYHQKAKELEAQGFSI